MLPEAATAAEIVRAAERHGWNPGCSVLTVTTGPMLPVIRTATDPAAARCERRSDYRPTPTGPPLWAR